MPLQANSSSFSLSSEGEANFRFLCSKVLNELLKDLEANKSRELDNASKAALRDACEELERLATQIGDGTILRVWPFYYIFGRSIFISIKEFKICIICWLKINGNNSKARIKRQKYYNIAKDKRHKLSTSIRISKKMLETDWDLDAITQCFVAFGKFASSAGFGSLKALLDKTIQGEDESVTEISVTISGGQSTFVSSSP